jgi:DNA-binding CsgD family transcriptional regulator
MYNAEVLMPLINCLYEASFDAGQWPAFLTELARVLEGTLPTLFLHDAGGHSGALAMNVGYDAGIVRAYKDHFAERNVWLRGGTHLLTPGRVRTSHIMCPRKALLRSEWYADYCRPLSISQGIGATIYRDSVMTSNIAVFAGDGRAEYDHNDMALLEALMPHLQRALRVHTCMAESDLRRRELAEAVEHLTVGMILVTANARVPFMNHAARCMVAIRDGLIVDGTDLRACRSGETATLRALIGAAAQTTAHKGLHPGDVFRIARPNRRPALEILVSPISAGQTWSLAERAVAAVYITDPAQIPDRPTAVLSRLHGLTPSEAKVAALIARGRSGRQAADELGLSYNTLKTHLKRIFAKTGTRSQGELIRLLVSGAGQANSRAVEL